MDLYGRTLTGVLRHSFVTLLVLLVTIGLNVYLLHPRAQGIFPAAGQRAADRAPIQADQDTSFQAMDRILRQMVNIVAADPAVDTVNGFTGGGGGGATNRARMFISLKPLDERKVSGGRDHRTGCGRNWRAYRARPAFCRRRRICASAAGRATRSISSPCAATTCRT